MGGYRDQSVMMDHYTHRKLEQISNKHSKTGGSMTDRASFAIDAAHAYHQRGYGVLTAGRIEVLLNRFEKAQKYDEIVAIIEGPEKEDDDG